MGVWPTHSPKENMGRGGTEIGRKGGGEKTRGRLLFSLSPFLPLSVPPFLPTLDRVRASLLQPVAFELFEQRGAGDTEGLGGG